jgi:hypothetical protein
VLAQLQLIGVLETDPDGVSLQRVLEDSLIALRFGNHDSVLVMTLLCCLEPDPLTDPVIVEGLGPRPALKREGKGRGLVNAFPRHRLLGLRPGEAGLHCRGDQLFAAISCLRVNTGVRYVPPGRSESLGAAAPVLL